MKLPDTIRTWTGAWPRAECFPLWRRQRVTEPSR